jgi:hypothetical protein
MKAQCSHHHEGKTGLDLGILPNRHGKSAQKQLTTVMQAAEKRRDHSSPSRYVQRFVLWGFRSFEANAASMVTIQHENHT